MRLTRERLKKIIREEANRMSEAKRGSGENFLKVKKNKDGVDIHIGSYSGRQRTLKLNRPQAKRLAKQINDKI